MNKTMTLAVMMLIGSMSQAHAQTMEGTFVFRPDILKICGETGSVVSDAIKKNYSGSFVLIKDSREAGMNRKFGLIRDWARDSWYRLQAGSRQGVIISPAYQLDIEDERTGKVDRSADCIFVLVGSEAKRIIDLNPSLQTADGKRILMEMFNRVASDMRAETVGYVK
jgi:hypothetical protein